MCIGCADSLMKNLRKKPFETGSGIESGTVVERDLAWDLRFCTAMLVRIGRLKKNRAPGRKWLSENMIVRILLKTADFRFLHPIAEKAGLSG